MSSDITPRVLCSSGDFAPDLEINWTNDKV